MTEPLATTWTLLPDAAGTPAYLASELFFIVIFIELYIFPPLPSPFPLSHPTLLPTPPHSPFTQEILSFPPS